MGAIAAAAIPAAISAAGAIGSGIANLFSQADTNKTNTKLTRETNAQNKELFERQLAWNEDMWNKSNAYNDPSQQVQRLEAAGINPAFVLGNGSMAEASPMSSAAAPQMQAPHVERLDYGQLATGIANSINTYYQGRIAASQVHSMEAGASKTEAEDMQIRKTMPYYIEQMNKMAQGEGWKADIAKTELAYLQAVNGQRISREFGNNRLLERQIKQADEQYLSYKLQNELAKVQLAYAPKMKEAELAHYYSAVNQMKANITLTMARADLTYQEKLNLIEERAGQIIDNEMKGFDRDIKRETKNVAIGLAKEELFKAEDERFERPYNFYRSHLGEGKRFGTPGISGAVDLYQYRDSKRSPFGNVYNSQYSNKYSGRTGRR